MRKAKKRSAASPGDAAEIRPQTRERILEAAIKEFAEHGFSGARIENIAGSAEANKQAIYYYFADKDDLYRHALEYCYELCHRVDDNLWFPHLPADQALHSLVDTLFGHLSQFRDVISVISDENRNRGRHLRGTKIRKINRPTIEAIASILARGKADGSIRSDIEPEQLWLSIMSLIMFYFSNSYTLSHLLDLDLTAPVCVERRRSEVARLISGAMRPEPPR